MGQYWQLINLDKEETFGCWGKLNEYLFSDLPGKVVPYLLAPSLAEIKDVNEAVMERGIRLDGKIAAQLRLKISQEEQKTSLGTGEMKNSNTNASEVSAQGQRHGIKRKGSLVQNIYTKKSKDETIPLRQNPGSYLESILPDASSEVSTIANEVIMTEILDAPLTDLMALVRVSPCYENAARQQILLGIKDVSWAGDRIICVGDYIRPPYPSALSAEELAETQRTFRDEDNGRVRRKELYKLASDNYGSPKDIHQFQPFIDTTASTDFVLRNLSKRLYVRAREVAINKQLINGPNIKHFGFGHIVLAFISWSDGTHDDWAADRFDIVSSDVLNNDVNKELWEDVSESFVENVKSYFEDELGKEWQEEMMCY